VKALWFSDPIFRDAGRQNDGDEPWQFLLFSLLSPNRKSRPRNTSAVHRRVHGEHVLDGAGQGPSICFRKKRRHQEADNEEQADNRRRRTVTAKPDDQRAGNQGTDASDEARCVEAEGDRSGAHPGREQFG
jgi:hypothetical protein